MSDPGRGELSGEPQSWTAATILQAGRTCIRPRRRSSFPVDGSLVRVVDSNPSYRFKEYRFGPLERVHVPARDGFVLEGELILPPDLDPAKKYPVWFNTYGGPHMPMTSEGWQGGRLRDQALASEGIIMFHLDPRTRQRQGGGLGLDGVQATGCARAGRYQGRHRLAQATALCGRNADRHERA